jgi:hypothetical protein
MVEVVQIMQNMSESKTQQVRAFLKDEQPYMALAVVYRVPIGTALVLFAGAAAKVLF